MNLIYKKYLVFTCLLMVALSAFSQDIHFSQFSEAPLLRNPSLAGLYEGDYRVQGVYRDQWNSITDAYRSGSFNAEYKKPVGGNSNDFFTAGLQCLFDKAGTAGLSTTELLPAVNYHKSLSNAKTMFLSLGFMGGYVQKSIDRSKVTTSNQFNNGVFNPSIADGETFPSASIHYWDASVGMSFNTSFGREERNSMFVGLSFQHVNRPKNNFYLSNIELDPKYVLSAGVKVAINEYSYVTLQADYSMQGAFTEAIGGALYSYKLEDPVNPKYIISLGSYFRWNDAMVPMLKLEMKPLSVAISYDVNLSQLKPASLGQGGFELSMTYIGFLERIDGAKYKMNSPHF